jgi:hypothetical protein
MFPRTGVLLKEAVRTMLEGAPTNVNVAALREAMATVERVAGVMT